MVIEKDIIIIGDRRVKICSIFGYFKYSTSGITIERIIGDGMDDFDVDFDTELDCQMMMEELDSLFVLNIPNYIRKEKLIELNKDE